MAEQRQSTPRVVIVGGGFGGIAAARELAGLPIDVLLVDRRNHHTFQPLLYQVATAVLSPADIASPIRHILRKQRNCRVVMAQVTGVDLARRVVQFGDVETTYDWLVLAAGATHSYFGHDAWKAVAPGLKSIEDATEIRKRILLAFESAEYEGSDDERRAALTFAIVGGGPTGVELAGAIKEIAARTIPHDFRNIDTRTARVILLQAGERLLPQFAPGLGERAHRDLEQLGVEVHLKCPVTEISAEGITAGGQCVAVRNVFWAAGVQANPIGHTLGCPVDRSGRVMVGADLTVPGSSSVFVIGDMAAVISAKDGKPVPGVAQGAIQMGRYVGRIIAREIQSGQQLDRRPFAYRDKGSMATIGRWRAVAEIGRAQFVGPAAWLLWAVVHIAFLVNFRNKVAVMASWFWQLITASRGARLITGDASLLVKTPLPDDRVHRIGQDHDEPVKGC